MRFAEKKPPVVGANETVNVQAAPAASGLRQWLLAAGTGKRAEELAMLLIWSDELSVPQLVTVTVRDLEVPATTRPTNRTALVAPRHGTAAATEASMTA